MWNGQVSFAQELKESTWQIQSHCRTKGKVEEVEVRRQIPPPSRRQRKGRLRRDEAPPAHFYHRTIRKGAGTEWLKTTLCCFSYSWPHSRSSRSSSLSSSSSSSVPLFFMFSATTHSWQRQLWRTAALLLVLSMLFAIATAAEKSDISRPNIYGET